MKTKTVISLFILAALLAVSALCQEPAAPRNLVAADVSALIRESTRKSSEHERVKAQHYSDFTYKLRLTERHKDKPEDSKLYEMYFPDTKRQYKRYRSVSILLEKNGQPIPEKQIEEEKRKAGEKLEKLEGKGTEKNEDAPAPTRWMHSQINLGRGKSVNLDVSEIMANCEFYSPRRIRINDREAIVLDFRPRPDAVFDERTKYMTQVEGSLWIDAQDHVVFHCAGWPKGAMPAQSERDQSLDSAAFSLELVRVKEGIWLTSRTHINGVKYAELFPSFKNIEYLAEHFDYQYFGVGIEKEKINLPMPESKKL